MDRNGNDTLAVLCGKVWNIFRDKWTLEELYPITEQKTAQGSQFMKTILFWFVGGLVWVVQILVSLGVICAVLTVELAARCKPLKSLLLKYPSWPAIALMIVAAFFAYIFVIGAYSLAFAFAFISDAAAYAIVVAPMTPAERRWLKYVSYLLLAFFLLVGISLPIRIP